MTDSSPLDDNAFSHIMADPALAGSACSLAVACSGGPDSMALAFLLSRWCRDNGRRLTALVVDHRLRQESAREAETVGARLAALGVRVAILVREGPKLTRDLQNQARLARYGLMLSWCREQGAGDLFLGHHLDDQAETFLLRLARGSGVDGLSAMSPIEMRGGIRLVRPLLDIPKTRLVATLEQAGQAFVQDPSNLSDHFTRNRLRRLMPTLAEEGMDARRLADTAKHLSRARQSLEFYTSQHLNRSGRLYPHGFVRLERATFLEAPEEIRLRSLSKLVSALGGADYPPRFDRLQRLMKRLEADADGAGTLSGCQLLVRGGRIWLAREPSAVSGPVPLEGVGSFIWDRRFRIMLSATKKWPKETDFFIGALGIDGWRQWQNSGREISGFSILPAFVRRGIPALWRGDKLVCPLSTQKSDHWQDHGIEEIHLIAGELFGKTAFSSLNMRTM
ncbi:tRNA lysidine(34) synthetase TilS [Aestuariispira insulae]|uniref:tRNA(Ile)-lysidine synthase n=1 Tax=Aestuariispira insulae TaxID=1461337 RepID=A0A3D9HK00_9PROT|nr:tRNA lysidine(34) synthetase TilS [Aestuariispira insulae]RED49793.1 tRNA(Ile)-lysidine synthase [Aestuariispira insulae]